MPKRPQNDFEKYHAHVYFDQTTAAFARKVCARAVTELNVKAGRFHERMVGPHPSWSCQLAFDRRHFDTVIDWLDANRGELTVFVHGLSGNALADHTVNATWLGEEAELNLSVFED